MCLPLWRLALLLDLGEDALGLVVLAVCALGHLAVALDLLLAAHVARLQPVSMMAPPPPPPQKLVLEVCVPEQCAASWGLLRRRGRPYHRGRTWSPGAFARGRTSRCRRCAAAGGSSWAGRRRRSHSGTCSWRARWQRRGMHVCAGQRGVVVF